MKQTHYLHSLLPEFQTKAPNIYQFNYIGQSLSTKFITSKKGAMKRGCGTCGLFKPSIYDHEQTVLEVRARTQVCSGLFGLYMSRKGPFGCQTSLRIISVVKCCIKSIMPLIWYVHVPNRLNRPQRYICYRYSYCMYQHTSQLWTTSDLLSTAPIKIGFKFHFKFVSLF